MTWRGLPVDYDAWKTRSDRDDGPDEEFEPEPEEDFSDMINENELAKELTDVIDAEVTAMPKAAGLKLKPNGGQPQPETSFEVEFPKLSTQIDQVIAGMEHRIRVLKAWKSTL